MKKILILLLVFSVGFITLGFITSKTSAVKPVFDKGTPDEMETAKQISLEILRNKAAQSAVGNVDDFQIEKVEIDDLNMAHTRVRQTVEGVPVWQGEAIVHLTANGEFSSLTDDLKENIVVDTKPNFEKTDAIRLARQMYKDSDSLTAEPLADLWIYRAKDRDHLVYRVEMRREDGSAETAMPVIFVDAQTGEKVFEYDNLQTGTGVSLYSGTVNIGTSSVGSTYYMENLTRRVGTFNFNYGTSTAARFTDTDDFWNSAIQQAGVDAHFGGEKTLDYFQNIHGRNGIDGSGGPGTVAAAANSSISLIASRVHYASGYNNAFWNGTTMTYGDGDGYTFSPLVTLDIAGHEMTHGVTQYTANLVYSGESGGLNESMSDVFGSMVESYARGGAITADTWKLGEQSYTPGTAGDALRYLDNPHGDGASIDHYAEYYSGMDVHYSSGIANNAFYLASAGGTHHLSGITVSGVGTNDVARIWYRALSVYMTSGTTFAGARTATLNAASDLFGSGSSQYSTVGLAWCAVGVGTCSSPTVTPTVTPTGSPCATPTVNPTPTSTPRPDPTLCPGCQIPVADPCSTPTPTPTVNPTPTPTVNPTPTPTVYPTPTPTRTPRGDPPPCPGCQIPLSGNSKN